MPLLLAFLICAGIAAAQTRGQAEVGSQGYYLGVNGQDLRHISGLTVQFEQFIPDLGLLRGSLQSYGSERSVRFGDNYLELRGVPWARRKWALTGGDFYLPSRMVDVPFYNLIYPDISIRGVKVEAAGENRRYTFFAGSETLLDGPRVTARYLAPQDIIGASVQQRIAGQLFFGARWQRLSSNDAVILDQLNLFPLGRRFQHVDSVTSQVLYKPFRSLRLFGEAAHSLRLVPFGDDAAMPAGNSAVAGFEFDTAKLTARANYSRFTADYLPVLGYFLGDRKGPFAEVRLRPWSRLEMFGSVTQSSNDLAAVRSGPVFNSRGSSGGFSLRLPFRFTGNAQVSTIDFSSRPVSGPEQRSKNRQMTANLTRPIRRHSLRAGYSDMTTHSHRLPMRQRFAELEDIVQMGRFAAGGSVRVQQMRESQSKDTVFVRALGRANLGRVSAFANVDLGNDLVNRSVFATNTYSTTTVGATGRLGRVWSFHGEAFRNRLVADLNPENIFILASRGTSVRTMLFQSNQWSFYFRVARQFQWGGGMPAEGLAKYAEVQVPLVGTVEGIVWQRRLGGNQPAAGIPIVLETGARVITNESGYFRFANVPQGPHKVALYADELPAEYNPGDAEQAVTVHPGRLVRADLTVVPLGSLRGRIIFPAGARIDSVVVRLVPTDRYTTPDPDGSFFFDNLPEGDYELQVDEATVPEGLMAAAALSAPAPLRSGAAAPELALELVARPAVVKKVRKVFEIDQTLVR